MSNPIGEILVTASRVPRATLPGYVYRPAMPGYSPSLQGTFWNGTLEANPQTQEVMERFYEDLEEIYEKLRNGDLEADNTSAIEEILVTAPSWSSMLLAYPALSTQFQNMARQAAQWMAPAARGVSMTNIVTLLSAIALSIEDTTLRLQIIESFIEELADAGIIITNALFIVLSADLIARTAAQPGALTENSAGETQYDPVGLPVPVNTPDATYSAETTESGVITTKEYLTVEPALFAPKEPEYVPPAPAEIVPIPNQAPPEPPPPEVPDPRKLGFPIPDLDITLPKPELPQFKPSEELIPQPWWDVTPNDPFPEWDVYDEIDGLTRQDPSESYREYQEKQRQMWADVWTDIGNIAERVNQDRVTTPSDMPLRPRNVPRRKTEPSVRPRPQGSPRIRFEPLSPAQWRLLPARLPGTRLQLTFRAAPKNRAVAEFALRVRNRPRRDTKEETTLRRDKKSKHNQAYVALVSLLNATWGRISEVLDFWEIVEANTYVIEGPGQRTPLSKYPTNDKPGIVLGMATGQIQYEFDDEQMLLDYHNERIQDAAIGTFSEWEKNAFREILDDFNITQLPTTTAQKASGINLE